jgi:hypothetical protein
MLNKNLVLISLYAVVLMNFDRSKMNKDKLNILKIA